MNQQSHRSEEGSTLMLALAFILALGVGVSALLSFLSAGLRAGSAVRDQGADVYAVDAAVETVIAQLRDTITLGEFGQACGPFTSSVNGRNVTVDCQPLTLPGGDGSRTVHTSGGGATSALPAGALVALGAEGIRIQNNDSKALKVKGDLYSNGPFDLVNGALDLDGQVHAPSCTGSGTLTNVSVPPVSPVCDVQPSPATDPGWTLAGVPQPPASPLGASHCDGPPVPAGTYTSAAAFSNLVSNCNGTLTFSGIYHLDFVDSVNCGSAGSARQWCILNDNATLLAGTTDVDGSCTSEGALFVLGGTTKITVRAGTLQLCGLVPVVGGPDVSVFASSPPPLPPVPPVAGALSLTPTSGRSTGNPSYANPSRGTAIDLLLASVTESAKDKTRTTTLELSGLTSGATIPATATITRVTARVAHREQVQNTATIGSRTLLVHLGAATSSFAIPGRTTLGTDSIDVTSAGFTAANAAAAEVSVEVTGTIGATGSWTSDVDGVVLDVEYTTPVVVPPPWGTITCASPPCTVIDTDGSNTRASFLGTIYVPTSTVSLQAVNHALTAAARGIVAREIRVQVPTIVDATNFHISLPDDGPLVTVRRDGLVRLTARITGDPRVRLETEVFLPDGLAPTGVVVSKWTVK